MKSSCQVCRCPCRGMQFSLRMKRRMCPWCAYNSQYVKREDGERECSTCCTPLAVCVVVWLGESRSPKVMCLDQSKIWQEIGRVILLLSQMFCKCLSELGSWFAGNCLDRVGLLSANWTFNWFLDSNLKIVFKMLVIIIFFFLYWISQFTCSHVLKKTEDGDFNCLFAIWWTSQLAYFCNFYFYFIFSRCTELL